ncbi:MAG: thioredoxin domain-containing protein [Bacteroidales bacterium]
MKKTNQHKHTNRLIHESSPYLLQHAHNPVDWHPWNKETLEKARSENKLMLISIGYSACHWCHVMERESFENEEIASLMNAHFINIKVDREERPDVDAVYMNAVQLIQGSGGWPLNCFALPDGRPFFGGTYFPPEQWQTLLGNVLKLYDRQKEDIEEQASRLTEGLQINDPMQFGHEPVRKFELNLLMSAMESWKKRFDPVNGGFKGAPKFPMPNNFLFLLKYAAITGDEQVKEHVELTLDRMASRGLYDLLGGGFSRYSVDEEWKVPHFEKMLYDNGQMIGLYAEAYRFTKNRKYLNVAEETADWALREMLSPEGVFYAALDADSEGEEGKFYVWTEEDFRKILTEDAGLFMDFFGIGKEALWEDGKNVLLKTSDEENFAREHQLNPNEFSEKLQKAKGSLFRARSTRERPGLDNKILTSWNALMIDGLSKLYKAGGNEKYKDAAVKAAGFLRDQLIGKNGRLLHAFTKDRTAVDGFLDDYALLCDAFIQMASITQEDSWILDAQKMAEYVLGNFIDEKEGFFWYTGDESHELVARRKEILDQVIPASNSVMGLVFFKLGKIFDHTRYTEVAVDMLSRLGESLQKYPGSFSNWSILHLYMSTNFYEVVVAGPEANLKQSELWQHYYPAQLTLATRRNSELPIFSDRFRTTRTRIFVCTDNMCKQPVETAEEAIAQIR